MLRVYHARPLHRTRHPDRPHAPPGATIHYSAPPADGQPLLEPLEAAAVLLLPAVPEAAEDAVLEVPPLDAPAELEDAPVLAAAELLDPGREDEPLPPVEPDALPELPDAALLEAPPLDDDELAMQVTRVPWAL